MYLLRLSLCCLLLLFLPLSQAADDYLSEPVAPADLQSRLDTLQAPLVVDLRKPAEFAIGHVPGAVNIPVSELEKRIDEVRQENGVVIYCINGARTRQAEPILYAHDIDNVYHLDGTFQAWLKGKYRMEKGGVKKGW